MENKFTVEIKYACQEILNRYYSVQVATRRFDSDPWWIEKILQIERNCDCFLSGEHAGVIWVRDYACKDLTENRSTAPDSKKQLLYIKKLKQGT